jgi:hypothetical protein
MNLTFGRLGQTICWKPGSAPNHSQKDRFNLLFLLMLNNSLRTRPNHVLSRPLLIIQRDPDNQARFDWLPCSVPFSLGHLRHT